MSLQDLCKSVETGDQDKAKDLAKQLVDGGTNPPSASPGLWLCPGLPFQQIYTGLEVTYSPPFLASDVFFFHIITSDISPDDY